MTKPNQVAQEVVFAEFHGEEAKNNFKAATRNRNQENIKELANFIKNSSSWQHGWVHKGKGDLSSMHDGNLEGHAKKLWGKKGVEMLGIEHPAWLALNHFPTYQDGGKLPQEPVQGHPKAKNHAITKEMMVRTLLRLAEEGTVYFD